MNSIIYIVGLVVVVLFVLSFFGLEPVVKQEIEGGAQGRHAQIMDGCTRSGMSDARRGRGG